MMCRAGQIQAAHAGVKIATAEGTPIRVRGEEAEEHSDGHDKHHDGLERAFRRHGHCCCVQGAVRQLLWQARSRFCCGLAWRAMMACRLHAIDRCSVRCLRVHQHVAHRVRAYVREHATLRARAHHVRYAGAYRPGHESCMRHEWLCMYQC